MQCSTQHSAQPEIENLSKGGTSQAVNTEAPSEGREEEDLKGWD